MDYSLTLSGSVLDVAPAYLGALGEDARLWRRSIRADGGFWQGSFYLDGSPAYLRAAFSTWLGAQIAENAHGVPSWDGLIYEMELAHGGVRRRRSLDLIYNAVNAVYDDDGEVLLAGYATQAQSIARYGRRERVLTGQKMAQATAQGFRDTFLAGNAWPWARPVAIGNQTQYRLDVKVCGFCFTAAWLFAVAGDGADHALDHWISALVGTAHGLSSDHGGAVGGAGDCQFLKAGKLASNTLQVEETINNDQTAWAVISELAALGDSSGKPWRVWVDFGRLLHYSAVDLEPRYYLKGGELFDSHSAPRIVNPWLVRPGVVIRDMDYPKTEGERGSVFSDARDLYLQEVEVSSGGALSLKTSTFDEIAALLAQKERGL